MIRGLLLQGAQHQSEALWPSDQQPSKNNISEQNTWKRAASTVVANNNMETNRSRIVKIIIGLPLCFS